MTEEKNTLSFLNHSGHQDLYPNKLVARFPHVAQRLEELWGDEEALSAYLSELLVPNRHDRQGFPPEVVSEIMALSMACGHVVSIQTESGTGTSHADVSPYLWEQERAVRELGRLDVPLKMASFRRAAEAGDRRTCALFASAGFGVDARDSRHWTPLMMAAFNGHEELALELIQYGAHIEACDTAGYTPMHWAAYNGFRNVVRLLARKGASADARSNAGITPLMQAAARGHADCVALLLERGADSNATAHDGSTPLLKAIANGHLRVVRQLLAAGASTDAAMKDGATLRDIARRAKDPRIKQIIESAVTRNT